MDFFNSLPERSKEEIVQPCCLSRAGGSVNARERARVAGGAGESGGSGCNLGLWWHLAPLPHRPCKLKPMSLYQLLWVKIFKAQRPSFGLRLLQR